MTMSERERLTWRGEENASTAFELPIERRERLAAEKEASAHPAYPDEGITHPAGYDDPGDRKSVV